MKNPYLALPEKNFWKTGFVEKGDLSLMDLYSKKFDINKNMPIVTAGSCFAQHIGKTLEKNGFNILDGEPPPIGLPERKLPLQVDNSKLEIPVLNVLGMNSIGVLSPRESWGLNSL